MTHTIQIGRLSALATGIAFCLAVGGCSTDAKLTTWQPATLQQTLAHRYGAGRPWLAFAPVEADAPLRDVFATQLAQHKPPGSRSVAYLAPPQRINANPFRLASTGSLPPAIFDPRGQLAPAASDASIANLSPLENARRQGFQVLVEGHVLESNLDTIPATDLPAPPPGKRSGKKRRPPRLEPRITVRWDALDVASGDHLGSTNVSLSLSAVDELYPDMAHIADGRERLIAGVCRSGWAQFEPTLQPQSLELDKPYISRGSAEVRKGNAAASAGLWEQAQYHWQNAAALHPRNKAAWRNLSVASAAAEDFEMSRVQLSRGKPWLPDKDYDALLRWIDSQQQARHAALGLPPREEGWLYPMAPPPTAVRPASSSESDVQLAPKDLDDMPWYTAIPFAKPPGWTWKAWLTQPWP